jgi:hypothetical protein
LAHVTGISAGDSSFQWLKASALVSACPEPTQISAKGIFFTADCGHSVGGGHSACGHSGVGGQVDAGFVDVQAAKPNTTKIPKTTRHPFDDFNVIFLYSFLLRISNNVLFPCFTIYFPVFHCRNFGRLPILKISTSYILVVEINRSFVALLYLNRVSICCASVSQNDE